jgi:hypothetical protein
MVDQEVAKAKKPTAKLKPKATKSKLKDKTQQNRIPPQKNTTDDFLLLLLLLRRTKKILLLPPDKIT